MNKKIKALKEEYQKAKVPEDGRKKAEAAMERAVFQKKRDRRSRKIKIGAVAAAMALCVILPNTSASVAMAVEKIPVLGDFFKVVTFRNYEYKDELHYAKVDVPKIQEEDGTETDSMKKINKSVEEYTDRLVAQFEEDMEAGGFPKGLDISYEVITDTKDWFTLEVWTVETMAGAAETRQYYNIDKKTGEQVKLSQLFKENAGYVSILTQEIKRQMREQMKKDESIMYFLDSEDMPESDFKEIQKEQNFYFNKKHELVIVFDEYEAAPGAMGVVEFVISGDVTAPILK